MRTAVGDIDGRWTNDTCSGLSVYVHACPWCGSQMEFEDKEMFGYAVAHPLQPDSLCWLGKTMNDGIRVPDVRGANVVTSRWLAYEAWEHHWKGLVTPPPAAQQTEEPQAYMYTVRRKRPGKVECSTFAAIDYQEWADTEWEEKEALSREPLYTRPQSPADSELVGKLRELADEMKTAEPATRNYWIQRIESLLSEHEGKA